jgi:hypothetical protein
MAESVSSREILPFIYSVSIQLTASQTGTKTLVLGADSEFELYGFEAVTNADNGNLTAGFTLNGIGAGTLTNAVQAPDCFKVLIKDVSTGRDLFTEALSRSMICGSTANLFVPEGYRIRFPRQNQLQFDFTNLFSAMPATLAPLSSSGQPQLSITLALRGYKIFGRML